MDEKRDYSESLYGELSEKLSRTNRSISIKQAELNVLENDNDIQLCLECLSLLTNTAARLLTEIDGLVDLIPREKVEKDLGTKWWWKLI